MSSIIVVMPKVDDAKSIRSLLLRSGYRSVIVCANGAQAMVSMDEVGEGVVISGYKLQDMLCTQLKEMMPESFDMLLLASQKFISECEGSSIYSMAMPLRIDALINAISGIESEQARRKKKRRQTPRVRSDEERKYIDDAKALLMEKRKLTEDEAHKYLQRTSMENGTDMAQTAQMVLSLMK